jgi:hypothetical protein
MTVVTAKTDSMGAETIIAYAVQEILDACGDLELEIRLTRSVKSAARLAQMIQSLERQLMRLNGLALSRSGRRSRRQGRILTLLPFASRTVA